MSAICELNPRPITGVINPQNKETIRAITRIVTSSQTGVAFTWRPPLLVPLTFTKLDGDANISLVDALNDRVSISLTSPVPDSSSKAIFVKAVASDGTEAALWFTFVNNAEAPAFFSWPNLVGHFIFDDLETLTDEGDGAITAIANRVPGGDSLIRGSTANVTYVTNQQNGRGCVRTTRTGVGATTGRIEASINSQLSTLFNDNDSYTVIIVFKPKDTNAGFIFAPCRTLGSGSNATQYKRLVRRSGSQSSADAQNDSAHTVLLPFGSAAGFAQDVPRIVVMRFTTTGNPYNGTMSVWDNSLVPVINEASRNLGSGSHFASMVLRLGAATLNGATDPTFSASGCTTDYYQMVVAKGAKSDADIQEAITWLSTSWGIALS